MKRLLPILLSLCLMLAGCSSQQAAQENNNLHILATTYPLYLFTKTLTAGVDGVEVSQLINEPVSCLHDYTLTVPDMKVIEKADVIVMNGADFESFMEDALAQTRAATIDCSESIDLLRAAGHDHHEHDDEHHHGHFDPHYWLDKEAALVMLNNILQGLCRLDAPHTDTYQANFSDAVRLFPKDGLDADSLSCPYLITFHDGFQYFAHGSGLTLLKSIEEEDGSTASAADIKEITALIQEYNIPAIFTETNGTDNTAQVIARETGVQVYSLDMIMSGEGQNISAYFDALNANYATIWEALS